MSSSFRGVSLEQDGRWSKSDEKLLQQMTREGKFPPIFDTKINLKRVNIAMINRWIQQRVIQLTGVDDDIIINTIVNILQTPDISPKRMQISVSAFLPKHAPKFMEELWALLADGQNQPGGVPSQLTEKKPSAPLVIAPASSAPPIEAPKRELSPPRERADKGRKVPESDDEENDRHHYRRHRRRDSSSSRSRSGSPAHPRDRHRRRDDSRSRRNHSRSRRDGERRRRDDSRDPDRQHQRRRHDSDDDSRGGRRQRSNRDEPRRRHRDRRSSSRSRSPMVDRSASKPLHQEETSTNTEA